MPTEVRVNIVNLRTGERRVLIKIFKNKLPRHNWIAYKPKIKVLKNYGKIKRKQVS